MFFHHVIGPIAHFRSRHATVVFALDNFKHLNTFKLRGVRSEEGVHTSWHIGAEFCSPSKCVNKCNLICVGGGRRGTCKVVDIGLHLVRGWGMWDERNVENVRNVSPHMHLNDFEIVSTYLYVGGAPFLCDCVNARYFCFVSFVCRRVIGDPGYWWVFYVGYAARASINPTRWSRDPICFPDKLWGVCIPARFFPKKSHNQYSTPPVFINRVQKNKKNRIFNPFLHNRVFLLHFSCHPDNRFFFLTRRHMLHPPGGGTVCVVIQ